MRVAKRIAVAMTAAALMTALAAGFSGSAGAAKCTPATNIEAILDDSGSMVITDTGRLRLAGMNLIISKPANDKKKLGAVEFGSNASTLFLPELIGANRATMKSTLDARILANDGSTNYNAAFDRAKADSPGADARIFLTDGGHNAGDYANGHQGGPPTYVVGFGTSTAGADGQRLLQIANDTGGKYYPQTDSSSLQAVMNEVDATLACRSIPQKFIDTLAAGQSKAHSLKVGKRIRSLDITLSWADPQNQVALTGLQIVNKGRVVASKRKRSRLKVKRTNGSTFVTLRVTKVKRGKLKFKIKAKKVLTPLVATTQVAQSRGR
jgi:hypothetical protein